MVHIANANAGNYDSPSDSQAEVLKQETPETAHGNQYPFPSSAPGYTYENSQQMNAAFVPPQTSSQMQNLAPFSSVMVMSLTFQVFLLVCETYYFGFGN